MENDNDNIVPEITAANPDGGAERLDADPISQDVHQSLDDLLDEAERETSPETTSNETLSTETSQQNSEPTESSLEPSSEHSSQSTTSEELHPSIGEARPAVDIDPEIAAIEQPRNLSEKNQNNWKKLQETASLYKKQAAEAEYLRQQLSQAQQQPAQTPADYEELKKFRQIFDIKNDPEFQSKYDQPLTAAKEGIYGIMRKHGASEEVIKSIEEAGGPDKIDGKWWQQNALSKLPFAEAKRLERNLTDIFDLKDKQDAELKYNAEHAEEILQQRQNQSKEWYQQETTQVRNYVEEITKEVPWARYQEIPQNATQEQVERAQMHNKAVADLEQKFNSALYPNTSNERASVAAAAVLSHVLTNQLRTEQANRSTLETQLKKLTEENNRLKASGKMPRQSVATTATNKPDVNSRIKMNASDAIDLGLDEAGA